MSRLTNEMNIKHWRKIQQTGGMGTDWSGRSKQTHGGYGLLAVENGSKLECPPRPNVPQRTIERYLWSDEESLTARLLLEEAVLEQT